MNSELRSVQASHLPPEHLRVNLRENALCVPKNALRFSWAMQSTRVDDIQTGYRIVIAERLTDMEEEKYLIDTGWVATDESNAVAITGADSLLAENSLYYWAVQTRDCDGGESALSVPRAFTTAVGTAFADTRLIWANPNEENAAKGVLPDFAFLRTKIDLPNYSEEAERAVLCVTAVSPEPSRQYVYNMYINGVHVGMGPARIGATQNGEEEVYYHAYDVTDWLRDGENVLCVVNYTTAEHGFLCQLTVYGKNADESEVVFNSARDAENVKGLDGTRAFGADGKSIGTNYYFAAAENIDAEQYPFGFAEIDFDDSAWQPVYLHEEPRTETAEEAEVETAEKEALTEPIFRAPLALVQSPARLLVPYPGDPVIRQERPVASVALLQEGEYLVDLGFEIVGSIRWNADAPMHHAVTLTFGEELTEEGTVRYPMRTGNAYRQHWTLKEGKQCLESYGMMTFRYLQISGAQMPITEEDVTAIVYAAEFNAEVSSFTCYNETIANLYDTFKYAVSVTNQDLYVDSQSRERRAYEGDALINMLSSYTYENRFALPRFSVRYLLTHRTWPAEYLLISIHNIRIDYLETGDATLLKESYAWIQKVIADLHPDEKTGLLPKPPIGAGNTNAIIVDWPMSSRDGYEMEKSYFNTVYNAFAYLAITDYAEMARALHKEQDATDASELAEDLKNAMIRMLYVPEQSAFCDGLTEHGEPVLHFSQHATAAALAFGVSADAAMTDALGRTLVGHGEIRTSIYFAYFVLEALYRAGFGTYATALLANNDMTPGTHNWAAALEAGNITIAPEAWNVREKPNMTFSHPWGSAPAILIARGMLGIRPTRPGYHKFNVHPQLGDMRYASITLPIVKGAIVLSVAQNNEAYEMEISVPTNTRATVYMPVLPGGENHLFVNQQKANYPLENGCFVVPLGAGTHRLQTN